MIRFLDKDRMPSKISGPEGGEIRGRGKAKNEMVGVCGTHVRDKK
jgi:hypothetical protein